MTEVRSPAAALLVLAGALELAAGQPDVPVEDVESIIRTGRTLVREVTALPADQLVGWRSAAAAFLRAWARHRPDSELIAAAEDLEWARDLLIASQPAARSN